MDARKEFAKGHAAISGKGIAHSRARADQRDRGKDHTEQGEDEKACTSGFAVGGFHEDFQERSPCCVDDIVDVVDAEEQAAEEDESREHADADAVEHDFGALALGIGNFFNHVCNCVEA